MARITDAELRGIIELDSDFVTTEFINYANSLVTDICVPEGYSDGTLRNIEIWLAAHFCANSNRAQQVAQETAGPVSATYQYRLGLFLASTMYGQQALAMDWKGGLAALSKRLETGRKGKVGITWLGTSCNPDIR
jgi:hypothetical protein